MRVAVLSDIHSNPYALDAVLAALAPFDEIWVLGDTVGYGPDPDGVVRRLAAGSTKAVQGNHDAAVVGRIGTSAFNGDARLAVEWTAEHISAETNAWLAALPERRMETDFTLVHGSPRDPLWEYLLSTPAARRNFSAFDTNHCLVGHTHLPLVFREDDGRVEVLAPSHGSRLELDQRRCILNPGSVGQPRDGDPRACGMTIDLDRGQVEWRRVRYDVAATQADMAALDLPPNLVERLEHGL